MQQLSLFDFGEEAPKPEKKKKASKEVTEKSMEVTNNEKTPDGDPEQKPSDAPIQLKEPATNEPKEDSGSLEEITPIVSAEATIPDGNLPAVPQPEANAQQPQTAVHAFEEDTTVASNSSAPVTASEIQIQGLNQDVHSEIDSFEYEQAEALHTPSSFSETELKPETPSSPLTDPSEDPQDVATTKEVVFANEQFGVKVVMRNTSNPNNSLTDNQAASNEIVEDPGNQSSTGQNNPFHEGTEAASMDTSFSPEDLEDFGSPGSLVEKTASEKEITNNEVSEDNIQQNESQSPESIPSQVSENKEVTNNEGAEQPINAIEKEEPQKGQHANGQSIESENDPKKPYYIEDQTVPIRKRGRMSFKQIDAEVDLIQVPPDEELFQKQYYPISVVAKWFRVNNSLLRFWENEFKILKPKKNKKGDRYFRPEDVKNLQLIYYLLRQKKLTINGAIKHLNSYREQTEVNMHLIQSLTEFKGFLLELKHSIEK
ncbi:DNA-binding transcriptional regulator, MerR family [Arachidicoccus rhizosphaerae]|uniref:DNA-binding transcriptional regulator, MerR family n=1 Tax=Arachidicoccus rhizosphaerae TaxID=551991 RepID=A0A1H4A392_9BACT|nr:MerR family transcriptional regulator [Arachidicoccus rhizosphaerae]SEA30248.1 DNA-binding transcriptional regulator, MerR family [Arachidicoccus rhizosphaerae]